MTQKKRPEEKLEVEEMILRFSKGAARLDKIRNEGQPRFDVLETKSRNPRDIPKILAEGG